jgi:predicted small secreted protein
VTSHRIRLLIALLAAGAVVASCSSTTDGTGTSTASGGAASSTPDFPSGSPPASSGPTPASATTSGSASNPGVHPAPATPLRTATVHADKGVTYVVNIWADVKDASCFDHAYGKAIVAFLTEHPCRGLDRVLGTTTVHGRPVGFAESATGFSGTPKDPYAYASEFTKLENADGTGSINDLLREGYRLPSGPTSVPASEAFNVLGQDNGVTVWDVWYLDGPTPANDKALVQMTQDIFLQF